MKGDPKVIDYLNQALTNELTAINQYWLHYRVLDNWGMKKLAAYERHESIEEMEHADKLAERILFLEALPNFQAIQASLWQYSVQVLFGQFLVVCATIVIATISRKLLFY